MNDRDETTPQTLRVLFVEDVENDQLLMQQALERAGFAIQPERVQTAEHMKARLRDAEWDLVLSDYNMPGFDALEALAIFKDSGVDVPFIVVSGSIGEDAAVEVLKGGAHDFIVKDRLARFAPAVRRELRDAATRRARREAELAARKAELRFRRIVETAQEGIWMMDADGRTTYLNDRMAQMLGATAEELIGKLALDWMDSDSVETMSECLKRGATREPSTERIECRLRRADRTRVLASITMNSVDDGTGGGLGHLAMVVDITEQRALQEQLMISDRMASLGTLAAGVAHEINNPLAVILTNVQLASDEVFGLAARYDDAVLHGDLKDELNDARDATRRLRDIVRDLKIFSRARETEAGPIDVQPVLESSLRMVWNEVRHRARVTRDYQANCLIHGNESKLGQVFINLMTNAVQAMDDSKASTNVINLSTRYDDLGNVLIEISDTGQGMSPEVQRRLFTPFFTTKPIGIGTGLGLSICRSIVDALDGTITVESTLGIGTTFRITLQRARGEVPAILSVAPPRPASRRAKVLVIDDEPIIGTTLRRLLTEHDVTIESDARQAIKRILLGARYDVVLCDLMMPEITGMELYAEIKAKSPSQAECIIFMTGGAFTPRSQTFLANVTNAHLEKPFDAGTLRSLINERLMMAVFPTINVV